MLSLQPSHPLCNSSAVSGTNPPGHAQGTQLPAALVLGEARVTGRMEGSQLAPEITATWAARAAEASGTAALSRDAMRFTCQAPALEASGTLFLRPPPLHAMKSVVTQARPALPCSWPVSLADLLRQVATAGRRVRQGRHSSITCLYAAPDASGSQ